METIKLLYNQGMTQTEIANKLGIRNDKVRYWLLKYEVIKSCTDNTVQGKICTTCKLYKNNIDFYKRSDTQRPTATCKQCHIEKVTSLRTQFKQQCVDYKGGMCNFCQYKDYIGALEFHHLDPNEKDFEISDVKVVKLTDKIKLELDKCILACSNCHKEIHYFGLQAKVDRHRTLNPTIVGSTPTQPTNNVALV